MKSFIISLLVLLSTSVYAQNEVLTNQTVTDLLNKGLSSSIVVSKIKTSKSNFDVSVDGLIRLKQQQVPDDVVNAMVEASANKENMVGDINDPNALHESGIYYYHTNEMNQLEPTVCAQTSQGSGIAARLTHGIVSTKTRAILDGGMARLQIEEQQPVFYFYFDKSSGNLNSSAQWFATSSSPNEFILIKMDVEERSRSFVTGSVNAYLGATSGVNEDYKVAFKIEKVRAGVYKVTPTYPIASGEYCFLYAGTVGVGIGAHNQKVFDFGIK